ncbi:MAG TPA: hypothetical protein VHM25_24195, partial [Polyangiaceae bacterium]|nr:hypothetical protein [Polyangiaceae bacterium]
MFVNRALRCSAKVVALVSRYGGAGGRAGLGGAAEPLAAEADVTAEADGDPDDALALALATAEDMDGCGLTLRVPRCAKKRDATSTASTTIEIPSANTARRCFIEK